jgi:hypothetical protein
MCRDTHLTSFEGPVGCPTRPNAVNGGMTFYWPGVARWQDGDFRIAIREHT